MFKYLLLLKLIEYLYSTAILFFLFTNNHALYFILLTCYLVILLSCYPVYFLSS